MSDTRRSCQAKKDSLRRESFWFEIGGTHRG